MSKRILSYVFVAALSVLLTTIFQPLSHLGALAQGQQARCQTFRETGKTVCGRFLEYWQQNGGLAQQGFPISDPFTEVSPLDGKAYTVQYFERAVFEFHPEEKRPYDVLLSQLGTFQYREKYPNGVTVPPADVLGTITGTLRFPSEVVPAMEIYAIEVAGPKFYSVSTTFNQQTFTIEEVAPGNYYIVGYLADNPESAGAYTEFVLCGLTASCNDHSLVPVTVKVGETVRNVRLEDWYVQPGTFPPKPDAPQGTLKYMWPTRIPQGLAIVKSKSSANEVSFMLQLEQPGGGQFYATITGGAGTPAKPPRGTAVTVRGQQGTLFTTGAGYSVYWDEGGVPYAIVGGLARNDALALAESLEPINLTIWQVRLAGVR